MATSNQLLELLRQRQAAEPSGSGFFSAGNIATGLGLAANVVGAATGKGAIGQGLAQAGLSFSARDRKAAARQKSAEVQQIQIAGLAQAGSEVGILNQDDVKIVQFMSDPKDVVSHITKRFKDKRQRSAVAQIFKNPEAMKRMGLDDPTDRFLFGIMMEADPDRGIGMLDAIMKGQQKLAGDQRSFKARQELKKLAALVNSKSELVLQSVQAGNSPETAIIDVFGKGDGQKILDDKTAALRQFPFLREDEASGGFWNAVLFKTTVLELDPTRTQASQLSQLPGPGSAQVAPATQPIQTEVQAQLQQLEQIEPGVAARFQTQFQQSRGRPMTDKELADALIKRLSFKQQQQSR